MAKKVKILMGSDSDWEVMKNAQSQLKKFEVESDVEVASAHRSPERVREICRTLEEKNYGVVICGAGLAAHLAGAVAAQTSLPVIGVPLCAPPLDGLDSLLATVQMPPGVPVATVAIGKVGAQNAGILAAQILALHDKELSQRLHLARQEMAQRVVEKNKKLPR